MPTSPLMRQRTKEAESKTSWQSLKKNRNDSYYTHTYSHKVDQTVSKRVGYDLGSSEEDD